MMRIRGNRSLVLIILMGAFLALPYFSARSFPGPSPVATVRAGYLQLARSIKASGTSVFSAVAESSRLMELLPEDHRSDELFRLIRGFDDLSPGELAQKLEELHFEDRAAIMATLKAEVGELFPSDRISPLLSDGGFARILAETGPGDFLRTISESGILRGIGRKNSRFNKFLFHLGEIHSDPSYTTIEQREEAIRSEIAAFKDRSPRDYEALRDTVEREHPYFGRRSSLRSESDDSPTSTQPVVEKLQFELPADRTNSKMAFRLARIEKKEDLDPSIHIPGQQDLRSKSLGTVFEISLKNGETIRGLYVDVYQNHLEILALDNRLVSLRPDEISGHQIAASERHPALEMELEELSRFSIETWRGPLLAAKREFFDILAQALHRNIRDGILAVADPQRPREDFARQLKEIQFQREELETINRLRKEMKRLELLHGLIRHRLFEIQMPENVLTISSNTNPTMSSRSRYASPPFPQELLEKRMPAPSQMIFEQLLRKSLEENGPLMEAVVSYLLSSNGVRDASRGKANPVQSN